MEANKVNRKLFGLTSNWQILPGDMEALLWVSKWKWIWNIKLYNAARKRERERKKKKQASNIIQDDLAFSYWASCCKFLQTKAKCEFVWQSVADNVSVMYRAFSIVRYITKIRWGKIITWIISVHQKYMCIMVTLLPTQRLRKMCFPFPMAEFFFWIVSGLSCSFGVVVRVEILLKTRQPVGSSLSLAHWGNDTEHSWTTVELLDCMLEDLCCRSSTIYYRVILKGH